MSDPIADEDGGRQFERTTLAWWRTMLLTVVVALLMLRQTDPGIERVVGAAGIGLSVVGALWIAASRLALLQRRTVATTGPGGRATVGLALSMATMQLVAVMLVL